MTGSQHPQLGWQLIQSHAVQKPQNDRSPAKAHDLLPFQMEHCSDPPNMRLGNRDGTHRYLSRLHEIRLNFEVHRMPPGDTITYAS